MNTCLAKRSEKEIMNRKLTVYLSKHSACFLNDDIVYFCGLTSPSKLSEIRIPLTSNHASEHFFSKAI